MALWANLHPSWALGLVIALGLAIGSKYQLLTLLPLFALGLALSAALAPGPFYALGIGFNLHWMLLAMVVVTAATLGALVYAGLTVGLHV